MTIKNTELALVEINPMGDIKRTVIWLHGLGADGHDFVPIVPELKLPESLGIRFVFPHAPVMPVTVNQGYRMRAWFDIYNGDIGRKVDTDGISNSQSAIERLIEAELAMGRSSSDILLAGFSQGAVIALTVGLQYQKPLAGILALSGFLPNQDAVIKNASQANASIPIFIAHGTHDPIVPYQLGELTAAVLQEASYPVSFHKYPMEHQVCLEEMNDIGRWIEGVLLP